MLKARPQELPDPTHSHAFPVRIRRFVGTVSGSSHLVKAEHKSIPYTRSVDLRGFEPLPAGVKVRYPRPLDDRSMYVLRITHYLSFRCPRPRS